MEGAEFEVDPAADFDLGDDHRRKPEPADLSPGDESLGFDGNVILAIFQGRDPFGVRHRGAGAGFHACSQDLASPPRRNLYDDCSGPGSSGTT